ncbi:MAG: SH3 domain-containing protein, partial [Christensenellales bacterium]
RTPENSFVLAPNGNGISVMGGGVSQVATTLNMALKELGNDIVIDEQHTFGSAYSAGYVEDVKDTVLTDYARGLDFRFTSNHAENLSISMWRAGSMVFCQLTGIGTATTAPDATPEPEPAASPTPDQPARASQTMYVFNVKSYVNLRSEPSTGAKSLMQIPEGAAVQFTGEQSGDFLQVIYNGKTGYAHRDYLSSESPNPTMLTVVNCQNNVSLWAEPSTRAAKLGMIPLGDKVEYLGDTEDGFHKIGYKGNVGYVITSYLTAPEQ